MSNLTPLLVAKELYKTYTTVDAELHVLRGVNLTLYPGEMVALIAPSGAGKSTLLHICGLLDNATLGSLIIAGRDCSEMDEAARSHVRCHALGFVYQFHYLLPEFSAQENVAIPMMLAGMPKRNAFERAEVLLDTFGLGDRKKHRPARLSGGEQQRVAFARAMANAPRILLADEPTGNLDPQTANVVFNYLKDAINASQTTALVATHNMDLAKRMDRIIYLVNGQTT